MAQRETRKSNLDFHVCNGGEHAVQHALHTEYSVHDPLKLSTPDARFFFAAKRWLVSVQGAVRLTTPVDKLQPWEAWLQPPVPDLGRGPLAGVLQE